MKTVAIISQKGGAGKTTICVHLAVAASMDGRNTAIIDIDPQISATNWGDRRLALSDLPVVISAQPARLAHELDRVKGNGGELCFIDTAPHAGTAALNAAKAADFILVPCRPAILDLDAMSDTIDLVKPTGKPFYVVMNAVGSSLRECREAEEAVEALGADVCPVRLTNRVAFSRALITGRTAQEFEPSGKATNEIEHLHKFVCEHIQSTETA